MTGVGVVRRRFALWLVALACAMSVPGPASAQAGHCGAGHLAELQFTVGEWDVESRTRLGDRTWEESTARSTVHRDLGGCTLVERYEGTREGRPFHALGTMGIHVDGRLQRAWSDSEHGAIVLYQGGATEDGISLEHTLVLGGRTVLLRHRYHSMRADGFVLESGRSSDGGVSWETTWIARYARRS